MTASRMLRMPLTGGARHVDLRVTPTPFPGLVIGGPWRGKFVVVCEPDLSVIGRHESPEAALACVLEIGPLADWQSAGGGKIRMPRALCERIDGIVRRWSGGPIWIGEGSRP